MGYFIDSISDAEMRLKIQQTRPKDLNEAIKVAVELEAFDRAERQRRGMKYARQTDTQAEEIKEDKKVQNKDLRKIVEQLMKMTKENEQKQAPSLKELVDLIKQESKHQVTNEKGNLPRDRPYSKPKKKNALSAGMTLILPMRVRRNLGATTVRIQGTNYMIVHKRNHQKTHLKLTNSQGRERQL